MVVMIEFFSNRERSPVRGAERYSDLAVVAGLIAVIALMIMPLPLVVLDILVALNITFAAILLLSAVYIRSPLELAVFPSVLLMSTLFRLALSVATTRMILLEADAGNIIQTFGALVAGGNVVVGLVIFLIITVVQFMVIAKGAERVAEVAARFSLDGMPGKQMSIDSDLRSGLIGKSEARAKRRELELESKLYGSLDGAMKFVKGDAMASIIIILINIIGGLAVGIAQRGMPVGEALQTYSILTIGDGLVAQVPALLAAMAAGLIVTRTASDEKESHLGDALGRQFGSRPRVLFIGAALCVLLSFVPGFPTVIFMLIGVLLAGLGAGRSPQLSSRMMQFAEPVAGPVRALLTRGAREVDHAPSVREAEATSLRPFVPLLMEVGKGQDVEALGNALDAVVDRVQLDLGLPLPGLSIHQTSRVRNGWVLMIHETPVASGEDEDSEALATAFEAALRREAGLFVGIQEANRILAAAGNTYPDVVQEVARALPVPQIAAVFRGLVAERVSIRDVRALLEALADAAPKASGTHELIEAARIGLRRHITFRHAPGGELRALRLAPALESELRTVLEQGQNGIRFGLEPRRAAEVIDAVRKEVRLKRCSLVLTQLDLRRAFFELTSPDLRDITVLSFHELLPQTKLDEVGVVEAVGEERSNTEEPMLPAGLTPALAE